MAPFERAIRAAFRGRSVMGACAKESKLAGKLRVEGWLKVVAECPFLVMVAHGSIDSRWDRRRGLKLALGRQKRTTPLSPVLVQKKHLLGLRVHKLPGACP